MDSPRAKTSTIRKFNPGTFQSNEEVIRQFVVREHELEIVLNVLRDNVETPSCQHILLVARRGMGKTMLLARVASELRTDHKLSRCLVPVRFMEESHEILDIADFWLETLFYLSKEVAGSDPDFGRELQDTHTDLTTRWRGDSLAERARAVVLDASDRLGRKLVLMVENLQTLCADVDDDFGWQLRRTLQTEPQVILIGTATSRFKGLDEAQEPFFELFRTINLEPLDTEACGRLWQVVSGDEVTDRRIRPLQILTGGSPRLLVIVAEFAQHRSLRQLIEELVTLVDDHTEYFRGHLEALAPTERRVYLAVIDLWQPSTTGEIAARARMDVRSVSSLLGRLVDRGAVTYDGSPRKREYAAAERLYSIYYKMRRERDEAAVVHNLIRFMAVFYSKDELTAMSEMFRAEATRFQSIREGFKRARADVPQIEQLFSQISDSGLEPVTVNREFICSDQKEAELSQVVKVAEDLISKADEKVQSREPEAAIEIFDSVVERFSDQESPRIQFMVAKAQLLKGMVLCGMGRLSEAYKDFTSVEERFHASRIPQFESLLAESMVNKGFVQKELGQLSDANATLESISERFADSDKPQIQKKVADALMLKATVQVELGNSLAAIGAYDEILKRFGAFEELPLKGLVAEALFNKAETQFELGDVESSVKSYDELIAWVDDDHRLNRHILVATAMINRGVAQWNLGNLSEAISSYDQVIERFGTSESTEIQAIVAKSFLNKGMMQGQLGRSEAEIATYDEVIDRFGDSTDSMVQLWIARTLINKGVALGNLGDNEGSIETYDLVVECFVDSNSEGLQQVVVMAMDNKALVQSQLGKYEESIATYDELIDRASASNNPWFQGAVAGAWVSKADNQIKIGRLSEAQRTCDTIQEMVGNLEAEQANDTRRQLHWIRIRVLLIQKDHTAAMDLFRSVYASADLDDQAILQEMIGSVVFIITTGASESDVLDILLSDDRKAEVLSPLVVALQKRTGLDVRATAEVNEVADDILRAIDNG